MKNRERMVAEIAALGRDVLARLDGQRDAAAQVQRKAFITLIAAPAAALIPASLAAVWIFRTQIQSPLHRLKATMQALADDRLDETVPFGAALPAIEGSPRTNVPSPWMMRPLGSGRED